ncbi:ribonuclease H-like domain-containing protein [Tanacetum coccineum]
MTSQDPTTNELLLKLIHQLGTLGFNSSSNMDSKDSGSTGNTLAQSPMLVAYQIGPTMSAQQLCVNNHPLGFPMMLGQPMFYYPTASQPGFVLPPAQPMIFPQPVQSNVMTCQPVTQSGNVGNTSLSGQATNLPHAFNTGTLHDLVSGAWNMDTGASSHLNNSVNSLSETFNTCMYPFISVGDGHSIPVTNTGHSILPTSLKSLHLNNVLITLHIVKNLIYVHQFFRYNNCTIEFDVFGFSIKDFMTRRVLLRCDSTWDLYPITTPSPIPHAFLVSQHTWHQRLGHPGGGKQGTDTAYLLLYVDDIVLTASFEILLQQIIRSLHQEFSMTDLGPLNYFLGISVTRDSLGLFLSQKKYAVEILDKAHMVNCNPGPTRIDTESKLGSDGDPVSDPTLYRSLAGSLQYLTFTRPYISYAVQQVCLYMHDPREPLFLALKRILQYVRSTLYYGLQLFLSSTTDLVAYSDADWAGCPTTRRSTSGYCVFRGNNLLSWSSKRQPTLSRSSAETEYRGAANVVSETCWLHNLLCELHTPLSPATLVYCDNVNAVYLSCNPFQDQRTKHIEIDIHFVRDLVAVGKVECFMHLPVISLRIFSLKAYLQLYLRSFVQV